MLKRNYIVEFGGILKPETEKWIFLPEFEISWNILKKEKTELRLNFYIIRSYKHCTNCVGL